MALVVSPPSFSRDIQTEVSPTFLSTPGTYPISSVTWQKSKQTRTQDSSRQTWGSHFTEYGGIGNRSLRGEPCKKVVLFPRSHRHFKSGSKPYRSTATQPYQLTPLLLSDSRINDQLLPAPLLTNEIELRYRARAPQRRDGPYTPHKSKFAVFPQTDGEFNAGNETREDTNNGGKHIEDICQTTKRGIKEGLCNRYCVTHYQQNYSYGSKSACSTCRRPGSSTFGKTCGGGSAPSAKEVKYSNHKYDETQPRDDVTSAADTEDAVHSCIRPKTPTTSNKLPSIRTIYCPVHGHVRRMRSAKKAKRVRIAEDHAAAASDVTPAPVEKRTSRVVMGVWPCWPPSTSCKIATEGTIVERRDHYTLPQAYMSSLLAQGHRCICGRLGRVDIPRQTTKTPSVNVANTAGPEPGALKHAGTTPEQNRRATVDSQFRTQAHRRYHELFPDLVPDLRQGHRTSKRYFFYGFHANAFRG